MTDDKGAGDGPYRKITHYIKSETGESRIDAYGDGVMELDVSKSDGKGILRLVNAAYSEGRKAAEKDFEELLDVANELYRGCEHNLARLAFVDWKKAREIE